MSKQREGRSQQRSCDEDEDKRSLIGDVDHRSERAQVQEEAAIVPRR